MACPRCHGLMVVDTFYDLAGIQLTYDCFNGWRCICCGNVWDRVIAANRAHVGEVFTSSRRKSPARRGGRAMMNPLEMLASPTLRTRPLARGDGRW